MKNYSFVLCMILGGFICSSHAVSWRNKHTAKQSFKDSIVRVAAQEGPVINQENELRKLMAPSMSSSLSWADLSGENRDENGRETNEFQADDDLIDDEQESPLLLPTSRPSDIAGENFNVEAKRQAVEALVHEAHTYLEQNTIAQALHEFSHGDHFIRGDLYVFVLDIHGNCLAHGDQPELIWKNLLTSKDSFGFPYIQALIDQARKSPQGGFVSYWAKNSTKVTFAKALMKNDTTYVICAGYYPQSKEYAVVNMVKGAVALFNTAVGTGTMQDVWGIISYPAGRFYVADLYLYALTFDGLIVAQGDNPGLIGRMALDEKDENGKFINQEIINALKEVDTGIWIEAVSRGAVKKIYAEKVVDGAGRYYFIACGYYPTVGRLDAEELVKKGIAYMETNGMSQSAKAFSQRHTTGYRHGGLYLFVYDLNGVVIAHGGNPALIGENQLNAQDENGVYYVREMIKQAKSGNGWVNFKIAKSLQAAYVELVDVGIEKYIIGTNLFPVDKYEAMQLLVKTGIGYLNSNDTLSAFAAFVRKGGDFVEGDLSLMVFDTAGLCYAYGEKYDFIWKDILSLKDDKGTSIIKEAIEMVKHGPDKMTFTVDKLMQTSYFEPITKNGKQYIIGSSFFH